MSNAWSKNVVAFLYYTSSRMDGFEYFSLCKGMSSLFKKLYWKWMGINGASRPPPIISPITAIGIFYPYCDSSISPPSPPSSGRPTPPPAFCPLFPSSTFYLWRFLCFSFGSSILKSNGETITLNLLFSLSILILWGGRTGVMGGVNEVIYVSLAVSHGGLISRESPIAINYKLVLVNSSLERVQQWEFIAACLFHQETLWPVRKAAYEVSLLPSEIPSEYDVYQIGLRSHHRHRGTSFSRTIFRHAISIPENAAIVRFWIR